MYKIILVVLFCSTANGLIINFNETHGNNKSRTSRQKRIINGVDAEINEFEYLVQLHFWKRESRDYAHGCGGTIIGPKFVLSAAHCVFKTVSKMQESSDIMIYYGDNNINPSNDFTFVETYWTHPRFDYRRSTANDICILKTIAEFKWRRGVAIAQLPYRQETVYNVRAKVAGWGQASSLSNGPYSPKTKLQKLTVELLHPLCFQRLYRDVNPGTRADCIYFHHNHNRGHGTTFGDSGGGLYYEGVVIGVISAGTSVQRGLQPDEATDVRAHLLDFIAPIVYDIDGKFIN